MVPTRTRGVGIRFNAEINLGAVLQAAVVLVGMTMYLVTSSNRSETAASGLVSLQTKMDTTVNGVQANVDKNMAALQDTLTRQNGDLRSALNDIRSQISSLPDYRARLDAIERWRNDVEARFSNQEARLRSLEGVTIETKAMMESLMRQANVPLPRSR